jgi:hypothetical protein
MMKLLRSSHPDGKNPERLAVEFYDHRVVAPVATEAENRRELVQRGLNVLATYTNGLC